MYQHERTANPIYPSPDRARVAAVHKRREFLEGTWRGQLAVHGTKQLGALRASLVGEWDTSACLFKSVIEQTCTMYDEQPAQPPGSLHDVLEGGGWWTIARQHQQYVRGLHESLVFVDWDPEWRVPTFELVTSDHVTADASPHNRTRPVTIWWVRQRTVPGGTDTAWFWDRWSIESGALTFQIWDNSRTRDLTSAFPAAARAATFTKEMRDEEGRAILPFALYHDRGAAQGLWSPHCRDEEVVFGTLQVGLLWTASVHGVLRASWSQRVLLNGKVKGGTTETVAGHAVRTLTPDPTKIMQVDGDAASIAEWSSPLDIEKSEKFARIYEARLAVHFGMSPSDLVIESLNPASGAAITVSQSGMRRIAKRDALNFRRGDAGLFEVVAAVARANGVPCSTKSVRTRYFGVALTIDERIKVVQYVKGEVELGIMDRISAYQETHPGTSVEDAEADLAAMDKRRMVGEDMGIDPAAPAADPGSPTEPVIADTAMNGAQVDSAKSVVLDVAAGQLPRESGVAMLEEFFQLESPAAERVMGTVGNGFVPTAKQAPPSFGAPPPTDADPDDEGEPADA